MLKYRKYVLYSVTVSSIIDHIIDQNIKIMSRLLAEIKMSSQNHRDLIQAIDELGAAIDDDGGSSLNDSVMRWLDLNRDG
jgi:hypothetical protein